MWPSTWEPRAGADSARKPAGLAQRAPRGTAVSNGRRLAWRNSRSTVDPTGPRCGRTFIQIVGAAKVFRICADARSGAAASGAFFAFCEPSRLTRGSYAPCEPPWSVPGQFWLWSWAAWCSRAPASPRPMVAAVPGATGVPGRWPAQADRAGVAHPALQAREQGAEARAPAAHCLKEARTARVARG